MPPPNLGLMEYLSYGGLAFAGSFLRANKWRNETSGDIVWSRIVIEVPIAIAVGSVAVGVGTYYKLDPKIIGGICGLLGLLGPAFFTSLGDAVISVIKSKFGKE